MDDFGPLRFVQNVCIRPKASTAPLFPRSSTKYRLICINAIEVCGGEEFRWPRKGQQKGTEGDLKEEAMKQLRIQIAAITGVLVAAPVLGYAQVNLDPYMDIGKVEYQSQCAVCHGELGKGDGSFNVMLKKQASDLTVLSKNNGGVFPFNRMYEVISGAADVAGHGPRNMPIWGNYYKYQASRELSASASQADLRAYARARILALVEYISTLQAK